MDLVVAVNPQTASVHVSKAVITRRWCQSYRVKLPSRQAISNCVRESARTAFEAREGGRPAVAFPFPFSTPLARTLAPVMKLFGTIFARTTDPTVAAGVAPAPAAAAAAGVV